MKRKLQLSKSSKEKMINEIKRFFLEERDEDLGDLSAMIILDFIIENIAPEFYNEGLKDAIKSLNEKIDDIYLLEI